MSDPIFTELQQEKWVLLANNIVVQQQPYPEDGFILAPLHIGIGWQCTGDEWFAPVPDSAAYRHQLLTQTNARASTLLQSLSAQYPQGEIQSWPAQVVEAERLQRDPHATSPLLTAIASARDVPLLLLAGRVLEKAHAYAQLSGAIIGRRQALEDQISAATSDQLHTINAAEGWPEVPA